MLNYVTRFVDGLQPQVHLLVAVQLPQDLETAYTIACVQEEVSTCDLVHVVPSPANTSRNAAVMHSVPRAVDDKKVHETVKSFNHNRLLEDKLLALKNYRKAKGLYFTCGERWSRNHKCQATVQLHVPDCQWSYRNLTFSSSFKILPLAHYDGIVGMDGYPPTVHKWWIGSRSGLPFNTRALGSVSDKG
jgi:hypothetical protein